MLSQLMVVFGFFALVLVMVYWVNASVSLFDELITDGHSAGIFLEFTLLSLPAVIALVMPMAAFGAAVYVTNRMAGESEMTVLKAAGLSPWRLARPVLVFGVLVAVMASVLAHVLVPASAGKLRLRESEISVSVSARLLHEGTFLHPARGVTFYIREITANGELLDVYLSDRRSVGRVFTYTAENAYVLRDDAGTRLTMRTGMAQDLRLADDTLSITNFNDLTYDISALVAPDGVPGRKARAISTRELLTDTDAVAQELNDRPGQILQEAHGRFEQALLCVVAALIGYAALMSASFSRFGATRQIVGAIFLLVLVKLVESTVNTPVRNSAALWPLVYLPSLVGLGIAAALLARASRNFRPACRPSEAPA
ncbi:permease [Salipiger aestuarii]|nr:LPS export ABC transporter permease LptF [Salipiger aestuarii]KAA8606300.1 permease [Salipiger aestuarii]KAB2540973.1 permease [Salipiger aestuarii]